jgi:hypothetical protein
MPKMLFMVAALAALAGLTVLAFRPAAAAEGRYCAVVFEGEGSVKEICHFNSFEACRLEVVSGSRGTCGNNPRWTGDAAPSKRVASRKQRRQ